MRLILLAGAAIVALAAPARSAAQALNQPTTSTSTSSSPSPSPSPSPLAVLRARAECIGNLPPMVPGPMEDCPLRLLQQRLVGRLLSNAPEVLESLRKLAAPDTIDGVYFAEELAIAAAARADVDAPRMFAAALERRRRLSGDEPGRLDTLIRAAQAAERAGDIPHAEEWARAVVDAPAATDSQRTHGVVVLARLAQARGRSDLVEEMLARIPPDTATTIEHSFDIAAIRIRIAAELGDPTMFVVELLSAIAPVGKLVQKGQPGVADMSSMAAAMAAFPDFLQAFFEGMSTAKSLFVEGAPANLPASFAALLDSMPDDAQSKMLLGPSWQAPIRAQIGNLIADRGDAQGARQQCDRAEAEMAALPLVSRRATEASLARCRAQISRMEGHVSEARARVTPMLHATEAGSAARIDMLEVIGRIALDEGKMLEAYRWLHEAAAIAQTRMGANGGTVRDPARYQDLYLAIVRVGWEASHAGAARTDSTN